MELPHETIDISPDGEIKIEAHGYRGKGCREATRCYEEAFGLRKAESNRTKKLAWFQAAVASAKAVVKGGWGK